MAIHQLLESLAGLKLTGMKQALYLQESQPAETDLTFD